MKKTISKITLSLLLLSSTAFADKEKVSLLLDWFVNPDHAAIIIAQQKGFFEKNNLEVEIMEPADPTMPPKLVAAKKADLAVDYQPQLQMQVAEGLPLVRIATLVNSPLNSLIVLKNSGINKIEDLKGKKVGTSVGSNYNKILTDFDKKKEIKLVYYDGDVTQIFQELKSGRIDATLNDRLTVNDNIKKLGLNVKTVGKVIDEVPSYFVFRKDSADLKAKIDKALLAMKKDGTLAKISKKWFTADYTK